MIGILNHACKVVRPGRSFLRRMLDPLKCPHVKQTGLRPTRHIRLNRGFHSDLLWWRLFADQWNGVAIAMPHDPQARMVTSDASGSWGCAAWSDQAWFQLHVRWDDRAAHLGIAVTGPNSHHSSGLGQSLVGSRSLLSLRQPGGGRSPQLKGKLRCAYDAHAAMSLLYRSLFSPTVVSCVYLYGC